MAQRASLLLKMSLTAILVLLIGCGRRDGREEPNASELGTVHGKVTLNGNSVSGAILMFRPDAKGAHQSTARSDENGAYKAMYYPDLEGISIGPCTIMVSFGMDLSRGVIPPKYSTESELKFEVRPGENTYHIEMTSR